MVSLKNNDLPFDPYETPKEIPDEPGEYPYIPEPFEPEDPELPEPEPPEPGYEENL